MKIHDKLDEVVAFVEAARSLPMSSSVVINKAELARLLEELRGLLPDDLVEAQAVLDRREAILTEAVANAERLLVAAEEEKQRLISDEEVLRAARIEAGTVIQAARAESEQMAREIDGYVDAKLAHLEVSITKLLDTVRQGREHLAQPGLYNELAAPDEPVPGGDADAGSDRPPVSELPGRLPDPHAYQLETSASHAPPPGSGNGDDGYTPADDRYLPADDGYQGYQPLVEPREPNPLTDDLWKPLPQRPVRTARWDDAGPAGMGSDDAPPAEVEAAEAAHADVVPGESAPDDAAPSSTEASAEVAPDEASAEVAPDEASTEAAPDEASAGAAPDEVSAEAAPDEVSAEAAPNGASPDEPPADARHEAEPPAPDEPEAESEDSPDLGDPVTTGRAPKRSRRPSR